MVLLSAEPDPPYNWLWLEESELGRREGGPPPRAHVLPTVLVRSALVTPDLTLAIEHKYLCPEDPGDEVAITGGAKHDPEHR